MFRNNKLDEWIIIDKRKHHYLYLKCTYRLSYIESIHNQLFYITEWVILNIADKYMNEMQCKQNNIQFKIKSQPNSSQANYAYTLQCT